MDTIISLDFNEELNTEQILNLFQSDNLKLNNELRAQMKKFKSNLEFFNFFTGNQAKSLLKTIEKLNIKLSQIIPNNSNDSYFSTLSKIYLSFNIIFKLKDILSKYLINLKLYREKNTLTADDKINYYLTNILSSINNISYDKDYTPKFLRNSENGSTTISNLSDYLKNEQENETPKFINEDTMSIGREKTLSPFQPSLKFENQLNEYRCLPKKKHGTMSSSLSIFSMIFEAPKDNEEKNIKNENTKSKSKSKSKSENKKKKKKRHCKSMKSIKTEKKIKRLNLNLGINEIKNKLKNTSDKNFSFNDNYCYDKYKSNNSIIRSKFGRKGSTDMYKNILDLINKSYKMGLLNSEEKIIFKQFTISKINYLSDIYLKYYNNFKIELPDKEIIAKIINEVKEIINCKP